LCVAAWKIRFDGFGKSNYAADGQEFGMLREPEIFDDAPPYYQPRGASHTGGTFADVVCTCPAANHPAAEKKEVKDGAAPKAPTPAELEPTLSAGCGVGK
jgi:hypothetical protein